MIVFWRLVIVFEFFFIPNCLKNWISFRFDIVVVETAFANGPTKLAVQY